MQAKSRQLKQQDWGQTHRHRWIVSRLCPEWVYNLYYLTNDQAKALVKWHKTTARVHHMYNKDTEHIRPLWVAQSQGSQVSQTDCEVDTGAGCNILPAHRAQQLFGQEWLRTLDPPRVQIEAYSGQSVHSLGSCVLHLHIDNKAFPTIFQVTNMSGLIILGRTQAKAMGDVEFPKIKWPHTFTMYPTTSEKICTIKTLVPETTTSFSPTDSRGTTPRVHVHKRELTKATQAKQSNQTTEPVVPQTKWNRDSIELNGKTHRLPITKDYMLKEYGDVFKGVGTLQWCFQGCQDPTRRTIPHQTKEAVQISVTPTQVSSSSHAIYLQSWTEWTSERRHNYWSQGSTADQWINSIVPVMKSNGSLRLCLVPKDFNKATERNQWYFKTIDDILPELAKSKYKTLNDATSGYWHVVLDLASSLLTMFNTP